MYIYRPFIWQAGLCFSDFSDQVVALILQFYILHFTVMVIVVFIHTALFQFILYPYCTYIHTNFEGFWVLQYIDSVLVQ